MRRTLLPVVSLLSFLLIVGCGGGSIPGVDDRPGGDLDVPVLDVHPQDVLADDGLDTPPDVDRDIPDRDDAATDIPVDPITDTPKDDGYVDPGRDETPQDPGHDDDAPTDTPDVPPTDVRPDNPPQDPGQDPSDPGSDGTIDAGECLRDLDCEGKVELATCQVPSCVDGTCVAAKAPLLAACDDLSACTKDDQCNVDGDCIGTLITCKDGDQCTTDTCDAATGCKFLPYVGACDDSNKCTKDETCATGYCAGTDVDCDDANTCTVDGCIAAVGCTHQKLDGGTCNDGDSCSTGDTCVNGVCKGTGGCDDGNACTRDTCTPGSPCTYEYLTGTACDDGDPCSANDHCQAGLCVGTHSCDDGNPCTADECTATGCLHRNTTDACDDGNACTSGDACSNGTCGGAAYTCTPGECEASAACDGQGGCTKVLKDDFTGCGADTNDCTDDVCKAGACTHPNKLNGSGCNDDNLCTQTDKCTDGVCVGTNPVTCPQADPCKAGSCDPETGTCSAQSKPEGASCEDGNRCTTSDHCHLGACVAGVLTVCGAQDQCHLVGTCDTATGLCSNPPKSDTSFCNDGNPCTQTDQCLSGACVGGNPVVCPVPDSCHEAGECNPGTGACVLPVKEDGAPCDDGTVCTRDDQCSAGKCAGIGYSCSDGLVCTTDTCDGLGGCVYTVRPNYCLAGGACRTPGKVNPLNVCQICDPATNPNGWSNNPGACSDGNSCTKNDACLAGACQGEAYSCDDGIDCTDDMCDGMGGCMNPLRSDQCRIDGTCRAQNESNPANTCQRCWPGTSQDSWSGRPEGDGCDDGAACTSDDVCTSGVCGGTSYACDDSLDCTTDTCDGRGGCVFTPVAGFCLVNGTCLPDGTPNPANECEACVAANAPEGWSAVREGETCTDGDTCTLVDLCRGGTCVGGQSKCDDGISCTTDSCGTDGGCVNALIAGYCLIDSACVQDGEVDSTNTCRKCDALASPNAWTAREGASCSDNDECSLNDVCVGEVCTGTPMDCSDGLGCTTDTCSMGTCSHEIQEGWCNIEAAGCFPTGAISPDSVCQKCDPTISTGLWSPNDAGACDDRISCTSDDTCVQGACRGTVYSCDDSLTCTVDACNGDGTCTHTAKAGTCAIGPSCWAEGDVDPNQFCQGCDPALDAYAWSPRDGAVCDDGLACTHTDACLLGACVGAAYSCDDSLPCTGDSCDGRGGCTNPIDGAWCVIENSCIGDQEPKPGDPCLGCIAGYQPRDWSPRDGRTCDDGNLCTLIDLCGGGACHGAPYSCDDGLACTADACDGTGGCSNDLQPGFCFIDNACVAADEVDPLSPCRVCDPAASLDGWSPRDNVACNDAISCTTDDTCLAGTCSGTPYSCSDGDDCTLDMCDGVGGCSNPLRGDVCKIDGVCHQAGEPRPDVSCEACVPGTNQFGWTVLNPNAQETCNGVDDNCDGILDPVDSPGCVVYYRDVDRDGYGVTQDFQCLCAPDAPYFAELPGDCDDERPDVNPNPQRREQCNGVDDNCDGLTDDENSIGCQPYYRDSDNDGHGLATDVRCLCEAWGVYRSLDRIDCNDGDATIYLGAPEVCDGKDNNCDELTDPPDAVGCRDYYLDADGDGYGLNATAQCRCAPVRPYSATVPGDCNDGAATVNPGRTDYCNNIDDDCSGYIDDNPLAVLCPMITGTDLHGTPGCSAVCRVNCIGPDAGVPGWNDTDGSLANGCECQGDVYDEGATHSCPAAVNLGTLSDGDGGTRVVDANLAVPGVDDWYQVTADDATWDSEADGCDKFNVRARFLSNPDDAFGIDVRRGSCEDVSLVCTGAMDAEWSTNTYNADAGECQCSTAKLETCESPTDVGVCIAKEGTDQNCNDCPGFAAAGTHQCSNNTSLFFIRVFRRPGKAPSCTFYQLEISNGLHPFSGT